MKFSKGEIFLNDNKKYPFLRKVPVQDELFDGDNVASATECTGLIPTPPLSEEEAESYTEIYNIPQPKNNVNNGLQHE